ncbi:MAG: serine phosphatase RsbU (regulator of sigma subunit)/Tfp pilus assembly protein PilF [Parvicellaceae bacterium]
MAHTLQIKIFLLVLFALCLPSYGSSQSYVDSLKTELVGASEKAKTRLHRNISLEYYGNDAVQFLEHAKKSTELAKQQKNKWAEAYTLRLMGIYYDGVSEYTKAKSLIDSAFAINLRLKDKGGVDACISSLGIIYYHQGKYVEALEKYQQVIKLYEESGELHKQAQFIGNIGGIYSALGQTEKGLAYYKEGLAVSRKSGDEKSIALSLNNYGSLLFETGDYVDAETILEEALVIKEKLNDKGSMAYVLQSLSAVYVQTGKPDKSREYLERAIILFEEVGNQIGLSTVYYNLARKYNDSDTAKAIELYLKAYDLANRSSNFELMHKTALMLGTRYYQTGDFKSSAEFTYLYAKIRDSIFETDRMSALSEMETKYQTEKKQKEIELLNKDNQLKSSELKSSREEELRKAKEVELLNKEQEMSTMLLAKTKAENIAKQKENEVLTLDKDIKTAQLETSEAKQAKSQAEADKLNALNKKRNIQLIAAAIGFFLLAILAVLVLRGYRQKKKANAQLEKKNDSITKQKFEIELQKDVIEEKSKDITDSIVYAKRIQEAILPPFRLMKELLPEHFLHYKPKDIVAGDFYWLEQVENSIIFAAADCTGHGVPGAMVSVVCNNAMNRAVREFGLNDPGLILDKTRILVADQFGKGDEDVKDGMDIALCSLNGNELKYSGANNPLWIIRKDGEEIEEIKATKQAIGKVDDPVPFTTHFIQLEKGDTFYVFSDGFADQFGGEKGKKFKSANFKRLLLSIQNGAMDDQCSVLDESFEAWRGDLEQLDDVCIIGVRI